MIALNVFRFLSLFLNFLLNISVQFAILSISVGTFNMSLVTAQCDIAYIYSRICICNSTLITIAIGRRSFIPKHLYCKKIQVNMMRKKYHYFAILKVVKNMTSVQYNVFKVLLNWSCINMYNCH